jgi:uncharacterized protein (TIGR00369 family)
MPITAEREQAIRKKFESNNFSRHLGFEIDLLDTDRARLGVTVRDQLLQLQGVMHGGAIASLIDTAVAFAIAVSSDADSRFTTVEMKINYIRPIRAGRVVAEARLVQNGRRIVVGDCDVIDAEGKLAAKALVTYIRLDDR